MSTTATLKDAPNVTQYRVTGMDCASCAAKIEKAVRTVGVDNVKVSTATQVMKLHAEAEQLPEIESAVTAIGIS